MKFYFWVIVLVLMTFGCKAIGKSDAAQVKFSSPEKVAGT